MAPSIFRGQIGRGAKPHARYLRMEWLEDRRLLAINNVSGDIASGTVWAADDIQRITDNARLPAGSTLTIQPGAIVQFNSSAGLGLLVEGTLSAQGTAANPILITSVRDDTGFDGLAGTTDDIDTGGDGATTGSNGEWNSIRFAATSTGNILDHLDVRFGGGSTAALVIETSALEFDNSLISRSGTQGVRINASSPALTDSILRDNTGAAISMNLASQPTIEGMTLMGNAINALVVDGGTLNANASWNNPDVVYVLGGNVAVAEGSTLTISPGQVIKGGGFLFKITVSGTLKAEGEPGQPIIFTNRADDTAGGDTYGDGVGDDRDAWGGIEFTPTSTGSVLDYVEVRLVNYSSAGQVFVNGGELTMTNSAIVNSSGEVAMNGMRIQSSSPTLLNNLFANNLGPALSMDLNSSPTISGITLVGNGLNGLSVDSGTLPGSRNWDDADIVYWLTGPITVPVGATLTLGPGQIIKGAFLSSGFLVDGTMLANGTAEKPIILTSRDDDTAGGDTNANGPVSIGLEDWAGIAFRAGSTGNILDHIDGRYVDSNPGGAGLVRADGGSGELRNSTIRNAAGFAVAAYNTGSLTLINNVIVNSGNAAVLAESGGFVTAVNNTLDGNFQGVRVRTASTADLRNNLITNNTNAGIFAENLATVTAVFNDVFSPQGTNYVGLADQTGINGNRSSDPKYISRANRQYQLRPGSPVVDVATSDSAPATDHLGNPRFDDPNAPNQGGGGSPFYDIGAFERQETSSSDVDLATLGVSGPTTGVPDEVVNVSWTVKNLGVGTASGPWSDAIYLSDQPTFSPAARLLGRLAHNGDLGPGQSYSSSTQVTLSGVLPGRHYFIVRSNDLGDVFEAAAVLNNAAASAAPIDFSLPTLVLGTPLPDQFNAAGQSRYYQLTVPSGQTLDLALDSAAASGVTELYVRQNALPSRSEFDFRATATTPDQDLIVPTTGPGTYYILAYANSGAAAASAFNLLATSAVFGIRGVTPNSAGNAGRVTVAIEGSRLTRDIQVSLIDGDGGETMAVATQFGDASKIFATFDLAGTAPGTYSVRISDLPLTDAAVDAFTVVPGVVGHLTTRIIVPGSIRTGFAGSLTVEYENDGEADLVAPILLLQAANADLRLSTEAAFDDSSLELMAINHDGPAGVLPPGAKGSVTVLFLPKGPGMVNFSLSDADPNKPFNWNSAKANLAPLGVSPQAWDAVFANFVASVGSTVGEYQAALARNATYLSELGEYVSDISRLRAFELAQAGNFGAITERYQLGAFGRGIPDATDVRAVTTSGGDVAIHNGGRIRSFFAQPGGFKGVAGDPGKLTLVGGAYQLRETDGSIIRFRPDGKLDYVEDPNGNRITSLYLNGRMTGQQDSLGDAISYVYNAQGRISQITDEVGRVTTLTYDASGEHLLSIAEPGGTTQFTYITGQGAAREHAVATVTPPDGVVRTFEYDIRGRLIRTFLGAGVEETEFSYFGPAGVTATNALDESVSILSNDLGQTAILQDALGRVTRFYYDSNHRLVRRQGPDGAIASMSYDGAGNLIRATNPLGQQLDTTVEGTFSRLTSLRDPRGGVLNYSSDSRGNLRSFALADGSAQQFSYDAAGNLTETINRRGQATQSTYDAQNLLEREDYADGSHTDYTYDPHRNMLTATDASGSTVMTYDSADRLATVTYPTGRSLTYTYDAAGRRATSVDQDNFTVKYFYDTVGRLEELKDAADARVIKYSYDASGRVNREDRGNGSFTVYTYFDDGLVQSIVHRAANDAILSQFDYTYDALGRPITRVDAAGTTTYGYDALGQLTSAALPGGRVITYQYDSMGNRVSVTDAGVTTDYSTNNLNQYTSVGTATFTYDADGNLVTKTDGGGTTTYTYDVRGRLVAVAGPAEQLSFEYDVFDNRAAVTRNGLRTQYLVDLSGLGEVVGEYGPAGQAIARYTHGAGLVSRVDAAGLPAYFAFDAVGNTAQLIGAGSSVLNAYSYLPFGELTSTSETIANSFTFAGQHGVMRDGEGLFYMHTRHYDANIGRFTAIDTIGISGGDVNLYRYVGNQPTTSVDPSGLAATKPIHGGPGGLGPARPPTVRVPRPSAPSGAFGRLEQALSGVSYAELQQILLKGGTVAIGLTVIAHNAYLDAHGVQSKEYLIGQTVLFGGLAISGFAIAETATVVYGAGTFVVFGGTLLAGFAGAAAAGAGGYLLGGYANKALHSDFINRYIPTKKILERTTGAIVDTFFAPERSKLGNRGKIWRDGVDLGLTREEILRNLSDAGLSQVSPVDPNDIAGPEGFGPQHFVSPEQTLPYTILFENKPDATAPAVLVTITHQLDSDLDWSTFEVGDFGFADLRVEVPVGLRFYSTRVDYTIERGEYVDVTAGIDLVSGIATWTFQSIDPLTGEQATDVDAGFLLPDIDPPEGEGFANFSVRAKSNLATGSLITAQASIVFDFNAPIETPIYSNTIDAIPPDSNATALPAQRPPRFLVNWQGIDDTGGSGVDRFDVYASVDGGNFQLWLGNTPLTSASFVGPAGHQYSFYTVATDHVGLIETALASAQTSTTTSASSWQNPDDQLNVNADGFVTPQDALIIINALNATGARHLDPPTSTPTKWIDVSGDDEFEPLDAIQVINYLNTFGSTTSAPSVSLESLSAVSQPPTFAAALMAEMEPSTTLDIAVTRLTLPMNSTSALADAELTELTAALARATSPVVGPSDLKCYESTNFSSLDHDLAPLESLRPNNRQSALFAVGSDVLGRGATSVASALGAAKRRVFAEENWADLKELDLDTSIDLLATVRV